MNEKEKLAKKISEEWDKEFEEEKKRCLDNLRDYYFYRLAIMYEIKIYMHEQGAERLSLDNLKWLDKYATLDQVCGWYCDREDGMWERIEGVLYDNYRWDEDYGERNN